MLKSLLSVFFTSRQYSGFITPKGKSLAAVPLRAAHATNRVAGNQ